MAAKLHSVRRWRSILDGLATGMDRVATEHLVQVFGTEIRLEGGDEPMRFTYRAERVRPAEPVTR